MRVAAGEGSRPPQPASHVLQRAIVLDRQRILFVPIPKAGCTALLWSLASLERLQESQFAGSSGREVTRALSIHDLNRWPQYLKFGERSPEERKEILESEGWLRFTVVRHPFHRLWSAWQSKILLAEPQFITKYSSQPWFPGPVTSAAEVLKSFGEFLSALEKEPDLLSLDVHWAPQVDVMEYGSLPYDHIGRVENLGETLGRVREHLSEGTVLPEPPRTNLSTLPYTDELFTEEDARLVAGMYADDMRLFGYEPPRTEALANAVSESWAAMVEAVAPALQELRLRNERVADMHDLLRARQQRLGELERRKKQEERLRHEEHWRNQRLQKRLNKAKNQLRTIRNSRTWRYTAPIRRAGARIRRLRRGAGGES